MQKYVLVMGKVAALLFLGCIFNMHPKASAETIFGTNVRVEDAASITSTQWDPAIAVDINGDIYVVWGDTRNGSNNDDIYFAKSTDGGFSFGPHIRVNDSGNSANQYEPAIAVAPNGYIYVVWADQRNGFWSDIYFARSTNGGASFEPDVRIDDDELGSYFVQRNAAIAVDTNGYIYVAWQDNRDSFVRGIYFAKSTNGGASFGTNIRVNDTGLSVSLYARPAIAVAANGYIYIAWDDERNLNYDIYFARSTNGGATFGSNIRVDDDLTGSKQEAPSIAVAPDGNIYVAWQDEQYSFDPDIYLTKSIDNGLSFGTDIPVDNAPSGDQLKPSIAADPNQNVYVTWYDNRNGVSNNDIYFAKSTNGGASFEDDERVDDDPLTTNHQNEPAIAVDTNGNVYVTWYDQRDSSQNIYFSKGIFIPPGDLDSDGDVDFEDFAMFALAWQSEDGQPRWNPKCNLYDADSVIDLLDLKILSENWLTGVGY